jgi:hypothetical protein
VSDVLIVRAQNPVVKDRTAPNQLTSSATGMRASVLEKALTAFCISGNEHVDRDADRDGDHRSEGEEQPLLTALGADRGFRLADQDVLDLLSLLLVDLQEQAADVQRRR